MKPHTLTHFTFRHYIKAKDSLVQIKWLSRFTRPTRLLVILLIFIPALSFGAQKVNPDSLSVLAITKYKTDETGNKAPHKVSYVAKGAKINLTLRDRREFTQVLVDGIHKDYIIISSGELVPLSAIHEISIGKSSDRVLSKVFGTIVLSIGILATYLVLWAAAAAAAAFLGFLLLWIPGFLWVKALLQKFPKFNKQRANFSLDTVSLSDLSEKARIKLSRRSRLFNKKIK